MSASLPSIATDEPEVGLLASVRQHVFLVAATTLLFAALGYGAAHSLTKEYAATATVTVARPDTLPVYRIVSAGDASNRQLTIADQLHDTRTLAAAATALGTTPGLLSGRVTVTAQAQTSLVDITVTGSTPAAAADAADAVVRAYETIAAQDQAQHTASSVAPLKTAAAQLGTQIVQLGQQVQARAGTVQSQIAAEFSASSAPTVAGAQDRAVQAALQGDPAFARLRASMANRQGQLDAITEKIRQLRVDGTLMGMPFSHVDAATEPKAPATLAPARAALLGGIVGLLVGCAVAWRRAERRRPMSLGRVGALLGAPVLLDMVLPGRSLSDLRRVGALSADDGRLASVAVALTQFCELHGLHRLVVAPATSEVEGPAVALALAAAVRRTGADVLLVDAGDGGGRLTTLSGLDGVTGFRDVVAGRASIDDTLAGLDLAQTSVPFVALGTGPEPTVASVVDRLSKLGGSTFMLVDAPGLDRSGQALALAAEGAALLLVTSGRSDARALKGARTNVALAGSRVVGIIHVTASSRRGRIRRRGGREPVAVQRPAGAAGTTPWLVGRPVDAPQP